jgi:hypothetical protein
MTSPCWPCKIRRMSVEVVAAEKITTDPSTKGLKFSLEHRIPANVKLMDGVYYLTTHSYTKLNHCDEA